MKCADCRKKTGEFLVKPATRSFLGLKWAGVRRTPLCREHLLQRFREEFLKLPQRLVVLYPNLEEKHGRYQYFFAPLGLLQKRGFTPDGLLNPALRASLTEWLALAAGPCHSCGQPGAVAFFTREQVRWDRRRGFLGTLFDQPLLQAITGPPLIFCRACAFEEIAKSFQAGGPQGFEGGVFLPPDREAGIYLTLEV
jgi:hypothetical protein